MDIVRVSVPGTLLYRDVVLRVVSSVCRLFRSRIETPEATQEASRRDCAKDFDDKVVSAVGEAFNNIAIHAYGDAQQGEASMELEVDLDKLTVRLLDTGEGFDLSAASGRTLDTLRESRMGVEIMLACMDEVTYARGGPTGPNVLVMSKRYCAAGAPATP